jgi:hypothetical protein
MKRPAFRPVTTTTLMGVAGVLVWLFWLGDPCLSTTIANHWTAKSPPTVSPTPPAGSSADFVVVENPYGIKTCHYRPTPADEVLNTSVFAIIAFAIGWLAARRISHRPVLAAAAITTAAMSIAVSLQYWSAWKDVGPSRLELLRFELLAVLVFLLVASGISMLGAWITLRFSRRRA